MLDRNLLRRSLRSWITPTPQLMREGPYWLQLVWTGLFGIAVGIMFTLIGFSIHARGDDWTSASNWARWLRINIGISLLISYWIHLLFEVGMRAVGCERLQRMSAWQRTLFFAGIPLFGTVSGLPVAMQVLSLGTSPMSSISIVIALLFSLVLHFFFDGRMREQIALRRGAEAQLKLLQAQIEPHFLFNTLANVVSLIEADPPKARRMLENFIDYLRASLQKMRLDESTLGAELDMAEAYLRLLQVRMDRRLRFSIDADARSRAAALPPLLLQPLVENAVQHGLEPKIEGGEVRVSARVEDGMLQLLVEDDGLGPDAPKPPGRRAGNGVALNNVRARLEARYGGRAALALEAATPGTRVRITLPLQAGA